MFSVNVVIVLIDGVWCLGDALATFGLYAVLDAVDRLLHCRETVLLVHRPSVDDVVRRSIHEHFDGKARTAQGLRAHQCVFDAFDAFHGEERDLHFRSDTQQWAETLGKM